MVNNLSANAGDAGSIPGSGNPLEEEMTTCSSILAWKNHMGRETWQDVVPGVAKELDMTEQPKHEHAWDHRKQCATLRLHLVSFGMAILLIVYFTLIHILI